MVGAQPLEDGFDSGPVMRVDECLDYWLLVS